MKKTTVFKAAIAASVFSLSTGANAVSLFGSNIYLDIGNNDYDTGAPACCSAKDPDTATGIFTEFGFSQFLATSVYDFSDGSIFGAFYDSNRASDLAFVPTSGTAIDGVTTVDLVLPEDPAQVDVDALSPLAPPLGSDNEGFLTTWELVSSYTLIGDLSASGPTYTGGTIEIIFREILDVDGDGIDQFTALELTVTGSSIVGPNLDLFMDVTFAVEDFLNVEISPGVFVDAADLVGTATPIKAALDTNVNPPIPTPDQLLLVDSDGDGQADAVARQSTLDGSIGFKAVPAPGTLMLMGLGLIGMSVRRLRRK